MSLAALRKEVVACEQCPRLTEHCRNIAQVKRRAYLEWDYWGKPVPSFGDPKARVLIVGLAPGAHGANRTGRMFTGDRSGEFLFRALHETGFASQPDSSSREDGLRLKDMWITATVRCAPPDNKPTREEFERCRPYLERELALLKRVRVVVALGKLAFDTYLGVRPQSKKPEFGHHRTFALADGTTLLSSYHPSQQNTSTGRLTAQMLHDVFMTARRML